MKLVGKCDDCKAKVAIELPKDGAEGLSNARCMVCGGAVTLGRPSQSGASDHGSPRTQIKRVT